MVVRAARGARSGRGRALAVALTAGALAALPGRAAAQGDRAAQGAPGSDTPPGVAWTLELALDPERGLVEGRGELRVRNDGAAPLGSLTLVLYPNRFRAPDPALTDVNFDRFYAPWFSAGGMTLRWVRGLDGRPLDVRAVPAGALPPGLPDGTVVEVTLPRPVVPGAWAEVDLAFGVEAPARFGTFGQRGRRLVLEGGFVPWVPAADGEGARDPRAPPALAAWDVGVRVVGPREGDPTPRVLVGRGRGWPVRVEAEPVRDGPGSGHVPGLAPHPASLPEVEVRADAGPGARVGEGLERLPARGRLRFVAATPSLVACPDLAPLATYPPQGEAPAVAVWGSPGTEERAERLVDLAQRVGTYLRTRLGLAPGAGPRALAFVEAPLRDRFVQASLDGDVVFFSDRLYRVFFPLRTFHDLEVVRAVCEALAAQALAGVAPAADRAWAAEAVGWVVTQAWLTEQRQLSGRTLRRGLGLFDFIPAIDQLVRAPRFVGSDVFYGRLYEAPDAVPDELGRALARRPRGRVVAEKLRDRLGNARLLALAGEVARAPARGLRDPAAAAAEEDLRAFFELWLGPPPRHNVRITGYEVLGRLPDGTERVRVRLAREGDPRPREVGEPVEVETDGPDGAPLRARWDGRGALGVVTTLRRDAWLWSPIQLDPDGRLDQTDTGDDRAPALGKLLVNRARVRVDLNRGNRNEAALGFTFVPGYDYAHRITVDAFYEQDERGFSLDYGYGFGFAIDERNYGLGVSAGFTAAQLFTGVLRRGALAAETEGDLLSVRAGVGFDTRLWSVNPTWGFAASFEWEHADRVLGSDFRFDLFAGSVSAVYSVVRGTQLGVSADLGQIEGGLVPSQRLFDAGGQGGVRGVQTSLFVGRAELTIQTELRQMLVEDLDVSLLGLAYLRKLQAVVFLDMGDVGDSIADLTRGGWKWGTGAGVRAYLDAFGVANVTVRFDVGFRIDDVEELGPEYYFGFGQSF